MTCFRRRRNPAAKSDISETGEGGKPFPACEGKRRKLKKEGAGRGTAGKAAVVGVNDRETNRVAAKHVSCTKANQVQGMVSEHVEPGTKVYTDEAAAYKGMSEFDHEAVNHSVAEYVRDMAHTNGMESFWSMIKRAHTGAFHKISPKHLDRYVQEFAARHNLRDRDTIDIMSAVAEGGVGKRLRYENLIADNGLASGARSA